MSEKSFSIAEAMDRIWGSLVNATDQPDTMIISGSGLKEIAKGDPELIAKVEQLLKDGKPFVHNGKKFELLITV